METDWFALWEELAIAFRHTGSAGGEEMVKRFRVREERKAERPDSLLDFVLARTGADATVLDIGAGTGRWTVPLARVARRVTALEPTPGMEEMLRAKVAAADLDNVDVVSSSWEDADVAPHDVVVSAHSIYLSPDLAGFVRKMERHARTACYLEIRIPPADGVVGELTRAVHGRFHDSPNAVIAFNALHSIGIYVNVLAEDALRPWTNDTFEEAFARAKRHLKLESSSAYDALIRKTLARRLTQTEGGYRWPDGLRSALLWWTPAASR